MFEIFVFGFFLGISFIAKNFEIFWLLLFYLIVYTIIFREEFWEKKIELFKENQKRIFKFFIFVILGIFLGSSFFKIFDAEKKRNESDLRSQNYQIEGKIEKLNPKISGQDFFVKNVKVDGKKISEKILVYGKLYPEMKNESNIKFSCKIYQPKNFESFDYKNYLKTYDVKYVCRFPKILKVNEDKNFLSKISNFKFFFAEKLEKILPEPNLSIVLGMTVGIDSGFLPKTKEDFGKTSLTHILVVSGSNIALILLIANLFTKKLGSFLSSIFSGFFAIFYATIVGFDPPVLRALIMGIILVFGNMTRRDYFARRALFVAGFFMTIFNPYFILYNISFLLSFWATFGIILSSKFLENKKKSLFFETLVFSVFAWIFTAPIIFLNFGFISIFGILANLLVVPIVPIITIFGFLLFAISLFSNFLATIFGFSLFVLTEWILLVVEILSF